MKLSFKLPGRADTSAMSVSRNANVQGYMNPMRDWALGLCVAILFFLVGAAYIAFDFYDQLGGIATIEVEDAPQPIVYRDKEIIFYADMYSKKELRFNTLRGEAPVVAPLATTTEDVVTDEEEGDGEESSDEVAAPSAD